MTHTGALEWRRSDYPGLDAASFDWFCNCWAVCRCGLCARPGAVAGHDNYNFNTSSRWCYYSIESFPAPSMCFKNTL